MSVLIECKKAYLGNKLVYNKYDTGTNVTTNGIYHNPVDGLITIRYSSSGFITIADRNLGATSCDVYNGNSFGDFFQWGNNHGFKPNIYQETSSTRVNASGYGPGNYYSNSKFIITSNNADWSTTVNNNLWGDTTNTNEARRGPCPTGFHIPSYSEILDIVSRMNTVLGHTVTLVDMNKYTLIPNSGYISYDGGINYSRDFSVGYVWTSSYYASGSYTNGFFWGGGNSGGTTGFYNRRGIGYPIRPFKNSYVIPKTSWIKLY